MKSEVYATVVNNEEYFLNRIVVSTNKVRETFSFKVMRKRLRACVRKNEGHFGSSLKKASELQQNCFYWPL